MKRGFHDRMITLGYNGKCENVMFHRLQRTLEIIFKYSNLAKKIPQTSVGLLYKVCFSLLSDDDIVKDK